MEEESKLLFKELGIEITGLTEIDGITIQRESLLSDNTYGNVKKLIPDLKNNFSSSFMTSLQKNAEKSQKWPLLNLVRQVLGVCGYKMMPIRKADGYSKQGVKKYKRYFMITKKSLQKKDNNENY